MRTNNGDTVKTVSNAIFLIKLSSAVYTASDEPLPSLTNKYLGNA